jgi:hypothetical protein
VLRRVRRGSNVDNAANAPGSFGLSGGLPLAGTFNTLAQSKPPELDVLEAKAMK